MSVAEVIEQVKALPAREREKVFLAILSLEEEPPSVSPKRTKHVKWPDVEARAKRIFGDRRLPNLVLLERDEYPSEAFHMLEIGEAESVNLSRRRLR